MPILNAGFFKDNNIIMAALKALNIPWLNSKKSRVMLGSLYIAALGY